MTTFSLMSDHEKRHHMREGSKIISRILGMSCIRCQENPSLKYYFVGGNDLCVYCNRYKGEP